MNNININNIRCPTCQHFLCSLGGNGYVYIKCNYMKCKAKLSILVESDDKKSIVYINGLIGQLYEPINNEMKNKIKENSKSIIYYN